MMNIRTQIKAVDELKDMTREERLEYFRSLPMLELKKYFGMKVKNPIYGDMHEVYLDKRGK